MVSPEMVAAGPAIVTFLVTAIGPLVRRIGEHALTEGAKLIMSPELAAATSARNDPVPESVQLVTESVAALATWAVSTLTDAAENITKNAATHLRNCADELS